MPRTGAAEVAFVCACVCVCMCVCARVRLPLHRTRVNFRFAELLKPPPGVAAGSGRPGSAAGRFFRFPQGWLGSFAPPPRPLLPPPTTLHPAAVGGIVLTTLASFRRDLCHELVPVHVQVCRAGRQLTHMFASARTASRG